MLLLLSFVHHFVHVVIKEKKNILNSKKENLVLKLLKLLDIGVLDVSISFL